MDKTVVGLMGAAAVLGAGSAQAAAVHPLSLDDAMQAASYADLLKPIPNALELLAASDAAAEADVLPAGDVMQVQYYYHHHHHHHHNQFLRRLLPPVVVLNDHHHHHHHRYYRRHHHHHHHHGYY